jgi:Centromere DNA-binding protein complex CBF3 subunit, domain 2
MRCLNILECPVSHLAMYLFYRFEMSDEFRPPPNMVDNESWFEWRLLTTGKYESLVRGVKPQSYSSCIGRVHKMKGWPTNHTGHIGRALGAKKLERLECNAVCLCVCVCVFLIQMLDSLSLFSLNKQEGIRALGNWNPTTQESTYSSKLPMREIRAMAGFVQSQGMHFNPRSVVVPPPELATLVFPWVDSTLETVREYEKENNVSKGTATAFLKLLLELRMVVLQDAAVYFLQHEDMVTDHLYFRCRIFQTELFKNYVEVMREALVTAEAENPIKATVESVLPGVQQQITNMHNDIIKVRRLMDEKRDQPAIVAGITGTSCCCLLLLYCSLLTLVSCFLLKSHR